jgi:TPR repeat protein
MYQQGQGVNQDDKQAVKWFRLAAKQGFAKAQYNLGVMYQQGQGVSQDYKTAVKWYALAAEQGDAEAQFNLGVMYFEGQGVLQDYVTAHMWANMASMNGSEMAPELRNAIAKEMTPAQIHAAQKRAKDCVAKNYKDC